MPHLSELHGAATHLAVIAIPLYLLVLVLGRLGRGGDAVRAWVPWVLGAALLGVASSGLTGLLVKGQSETQLRGSDYGIGGIHFWLGIALAVVLLAAAGRTVVRRRRGEAPWTVGGAGLAIALVAAVAVFAQGYFGGRMTYEHGVGVQALGEGAQSATGASALHVALASGTDDAAAGKAAFARTGLGCASCHGEQAEGARGPRLAGGKKLDDFRRVHEHGLFPPSVVTDRDFKAIDAYLKTLGTARD